MIGLGELEEWAKGLSGSDAPTTPKPPARPARKYVPRYDKCEACHIRQPCLYATVGRIDGRTKRLWICSPECEELARKAFDTE